MTRAVDGRTTAFHREAMATVLALAALVAYYAVRFRDAILTFFFLDDFWCMSVAAHLQIHSWRDVAQFFLPSHAGFLLYRPLTQGGYFYVLRQLFGYDASGYHAFHLLVHAVTASLVFAIARALSASTLAGLAVALIYAAAPGHGVAVYWISAFTMTGAALIVFSMLCLWLYTDGVWRALGCSVLQVFGLLASEHACVAPALLAVVALFSGRREPWARVVRDLAGPSVLVAAYLALKLYWLHTGTLVLYPPYEPTFDAAAWAVEFGRYAAASFNALTLLDLNERAARALGFSLIVLAVVAGWRAARGGDRWRLLAIGSAMFVISLLPVLPVAHHHCDYFIGIAALGAALAVLGGCQVVTQHWRWLVSGAAACLLLVDVATAGSALRSNEWLRDVSGGAQASARWLQSLPQVYGRGRFVTTEILVPRDGLTESVFGTWAQAEHLFYPGRPPVILYDPKQAPSPAPGRIVLAGASPLMGRLPGWEHRFDWLRALAAGSQ